MTHGSFFVFVFYEEAGFEVCIFRCITGWTGYEGSNMHAQLLVMHQTFFLVDRTVDYQMHFSKNLYSLFYSWALFVCLNSNLLSCYTMNFPQHSIKV